MENSNITLSQRIQGVGLVIDILSCVVFFFPINMSGNHQRVDKSASQALKSYDKLRFINKSASDRYYSFLDDKTLIPKWGIKPHETKNGGIADMIKERGCENFTKQPKAAVVTIVKEFYANAKEFEGYVI